MHPYLTSILAEVHMEDLRRDAAHHRLVAQARAARTGGTRLGGGAWRTALERATTTLRRRAKPEPVAGRAPRAACCPA